MFKRNTRNSQYWLSLFSVLALFIYGLQGYLDENNVFYSIEQIHLYDETIFSNSLVVASNAMSARFFLNGIVCLLMKMLNGDWLRACLVLIYLGVIVLAVAAVEICYKISNKHCFYLSCVLGFLIVTSTNTSYCNWKAFYVHSIGIGTGFAFSLLAISSIIGEKKKWNLAWFFLAIATVFHVHEGMYGFCVIFVLYFLSCLENKKMLVDRQQACFILFFIVLILSVIPGLFGEKSIYTDSEFVEIYAINMLPFHLDPKSWGLSEILKLFFEITGLAGIRFLTIKNCKKDKIKIFIVEASIFLLSYWVAVGIQYCAIYLLPSSKIITMYIPKYFKYVGIISLIWGVESIADWIDKKRYLIAGLVFSTIIAGDVNDCVWALFVYVVSILVIILLVKVNNSIFKIVLGVSLAIIVCITFPIGRKTILAATIFLLTIKIWEKADVIEQIVLSKYTVAIISIGLLVIASKDKIWQFESGRVSLLNENQYVINAIGEERYQLAVDYGKSTRSDEVFLCDYLEKYMHYFQNISERTCYCTSKVQVSDMSLFAELESRHQEVENLFSHDLAYITNLMQSNNIKYIYVDKDNYGLFNQSDFKVFLTSENDNYRIYELE